jgi:hypothetical protein
VFIIPYPHKFIIMTLVTRLVEQQCDDSTDGLTFRVMDRVGRMNHRAVHFLRQGQELDAVEVLKRALELLLTMTREGVHPWDTAERSDVACDCLPSGVAVLHLPPMDVVTLEEEEQPPPPSAVIAVTDFSQLAQLGFDPTQQLLVTITLYHTALAFHRWCCRTQARLPGELCRSRDLYLLCEAALAHCPHTNELKGVVQASFADLWSLFDWPPAA